MKKQKLAYEYLSRKMKQLNVDTKLTEDGIKAKKVDEEKTKEREIEMKSKENMFESESMERFTKMLGLMYEMRNWDNNNDINAIDMRLIRDTYKTEEQNRSMMVAEKNEERNNSGMICERCESCEKNQRKERRRRAMKKREMYGKWMKKEDEKTY